MLGGADVRCEPQTPGGVARPPPGCEGRGWSFEGGGPPSVSADPLGVAAGPPHRWTAEGRSAGPWIGYCTPGRGPMPHELSQRGMCVCVRAETPSLGCVCSGAVIWIEASGWDPDWDVALYGGCFRSMYDILGKKTCNGIHRAKLNLCNRYDLGCI